MHKRTTPKVFAHATPALAGGAREELRRELTPTEVKLWARLRAHRMKGVHFRAHTCPGGRCQGHAIGNYIVDFCAARKKLIIELDGSQHLEQTEYDAERTRFLESKGYRVLRFWNNDVTNNMDAVLNEIWDTLS